MKKFKLSRKQRRKLKKLNKWGKETASLFVIISLLFFFFFQYGWTGLFFHSMVSDELIDNCTGIAIFFTNTSFRGDYNFMFNQYGGCYSNDIISPFSVKADLLMPVDLAECRSQFDCEDFSHAVKCLADLYSVDCEYYAQDTYSQREGKTFHMGLDCFYKGEWVRFN